MRWAFARGPPRLGLSLLGTRHPHTLLSPQTQASSMVLTLSAVRGPSCAGPGSVNTSLETCQWFWHLSPGLMGFVSGPSNVELLLQGPSHLGPTSFQRQQPLGLQGPRAEDGGGPYGVTGLPHGFLMVQIEVSLLPLRVEEAIRRVAGQ